MLKYILVSVYIFYSMSLYYKYKIPPWVILFLANIYTANCYVFHPLKYLNTESLVLYQLDYIVNHVTPCLVLLLHTYRLRPYVHDTLNNGTHIKISVYSYLLHLFFVVYENKNISFNQHLFFYVGHQLPYYLCKTKLN